MFRRLAGAMRRRAPSVPDAGTLQPPVPGPVEEVAAPPTGSDPVEASDAEAVEQFWDDKNKPDAELPPNAAWWNAPLIMRHINRVVCGEPIDGIHAGFHRRLRDFMTDMPHPRRALSIGCGAGTKEMDALALGVADTFECYDVSGEAVRVARQIAQDRGLADQIVFHHADAFAADLRSDFDLVYWNNALHHMMDVHASVQWSRDHLRQGGVFAMDDYVGATRFQHSPEFVAWGSRLLALLPEHLRRHWNGTDVIPTVVGVLDPAELARIDPSECADSGSILPAVKSIFPDAEIIKTGGIAYFIALTHTFHNYTSETELALLNAILMADEAVSDRVESQYAVVIARKS